MDYDYIIVGGGSAGGILASRLTEDRDCSVLLLEAGTDFPDLDRMPDEVKYGYGSRLSVWDSPHNWNFTAKATEEADHIIVPRGKVMGGSSAINAQMFLRGVPEDYDGWAEMGNDEWSFQQMLPYFRKVESDQDFAGDFHGTDGPIICSRPPREQWLPPQEAFFEACRAAGYADCPDHNAPDATGVGPLAFNTVDRVRWSTAIAYIGPARPRLNLTIRSECLARRVLFDGLRAVGVEAESGGEKFTVRGREVILSGGAIGSPHLLMLSGVGPAEHLRDHGIPVVADLPGVGQNLRDHPLVQLAWSVRPGVDLDLDAKKSGLVLRYTASGSHLPNDMIVYMASAMSKRIDRGGDPRQPIGVGVVAVLNLALGAGSVSLTSPDPHSQPLIDFNYLTEPFDRERLREAVRICDELSASDAFAHIVSDRVNPGPEVDIASDRELDAWLMGEVTTAHHSSCTCKMGAPDDPMAVVDQFGRVRGLKSLRVTDASIMPDCVRANTNATVLAMAEKIADFIKAGR